MLVRNQVSAVPATLLAVVLYSERQRLREIAEREAAGHDIWTNVIPREAIVKLVLVWEVLEQVAGGRERQLNGWVDRHLRMAGRYPVPCAQSRDLLSAWVGHAGAFPLLDVLEALHASLAQIEPLSHEWPSRLSESINEIFNDHRIAFKMVDGEFIPYRGDPVFSATVEPTIRLLISKQFDGAQKAFREALREIKDGHPDDAITDAGTALQETLTELGYSGNALGPLISDAKKRGVFAGHDAKLANAIEESLHWASANRSELGDAHKVVPSTLDDAWLMVHVVGALILRLASSPAAQA